MGNNSSKVKGSKGSKGTDEGLGGLEKLRNGTANNSQAFKKIVIGEEEIVRRDREHAASKIDLDNSTNEVETLNQRISDLEAQRATLEQEKRDEVGRLKAELAKELDGQVRIAESLTQERNRERQKVG